MAKEFTVKQQAFIDAFDNDTRAAAKKAGISYGHARNLLTEPDIVKAIKKREQKEIRPLRIATRQERQNFWTTVLEDPKVSMKDRLKASELLGKSNKDFTDKVELSGKIGLGEILSKVGKQ